MRVSNFAMAAASAAILAAPPAWADVTADQVWADLEAYLTSFGYEVTAEESRSGDTLTLTEMTLRKPLPEDEGEVTFVIEQLALRDQGDGTVALDMPTTMPVQVNVAPSDDKSVDMTLDYTLEDMEMIIAGEPDDMTYVYSASSLALVLSDLVIDGETVSRDDMAGQISAGPVDGETRVSLADGMREIHQQLSLGTVSYDFTGGDPEGDDEGMITGTLEGVSSDATTELPQDVSTDNPSELLQAGMMVDGAIRYTAGQSRFAMTEGGQTTSGETSSKGGSFAMKMSQESLDYDVRSMGVNIDVTSPDMPLPISAQMDEMRLHFLTPVGASEEPVDAAVNLTLAGFTTSDMIWSIFDPKGILPRDPATVVIDLAGKVTPKVDILDPKQMESLDGSTPPGELNALTLNNLTIDAAGAQITGQGDFTFDNTDLQSFDGMPRPEGVLNLQMSGANGLIDKLIEMGFVSEQDAMGARMMMSMFAVPGSEPDTLTSKIEVNEQGHVLANGQRIK
ncbi:DUF2125 domain-containing protein [Salipiger sp.]|uniref:DUF2125 domain-containing protein n=1 Tax=Salipiger sp. TaxID=2078585 RepID=UPI003A96B266